MDSKTKPISAKEFQDRREAICGNRVPQPRPTRPAEITFIGPFGWPYFQSLYIALGCVFAMFSIAMCVIAYRDYCERVDKESNVYRIEIDNRLYENCVYKYPNYYTSEGGVIVFGKNSRIITKTGAKR